MRRVTLMLAAMAVMVSLFAVAAYAATIDGTDRGEILLESNENDTIYGRGGGDLIDAQIFGPDFGDPPDKDVVFGNPGNDEIGVEDGDGRDTVYGGKGDDECWGDPGDELHCEEDHRLPSPIN
jgi:hemolysin type calcium-binding protein